MSGSGKSAAGKQFAEHVKCARVGSNTEALMKFVDGYVQWESEEDEQSFLVFCEPHKCPSLELQKFSAWLKGVIESHLSDGGEKLLYATFLSGFLRELPASAGGFESDRYLMLAERAMRDACSTPHERSSTRQVGNSSFLH